MLSGSNSSTTFRDDSLDVQYSPFTMDTSENLATGAVIQNLINRKKNLDKGGVNCIPMPFERFRSEVPGVEQGQYVVITGSTKSAKTMLMSYVYLYNALEYCFQNPAKCSCHIIYFALEESPQRVIERYMSHLLWQLDEMRLAPTDLRSTNSDYPIPDSAIELLKSKPYQDRLKFFEDHVQFETENTNATGIRNVCINYAKSVGKIHSHKVKSNADPTKEIDVFDSYEPNDPNHYKICIIDHISLIDQERGYRLKDSIDKLSEYCVKYLRNRFGFTCVAVQQQAFDNEGLEAMKQKRLTPTLAALSDTKYTSRDANMVLGIFNPNKFGIPTWGGGYDITRLGNYARFVTVLANRDGEVGGTCPLFFDGAVCRFEELPRTDDINGLAKVYKEAENMRTYRQQRRFMSLRATVLMIFKHFKSILI